MKDEIKDKAKEILDTIKMSLTQRQEELIIENMLEFGRFVCEEQKKECSKSLDGLIVKTMSKVFILNSKNVCDL